ncbi:MAG: glycosyltransferase family 2 protein [Vicingaceae bacterium]|nr:glycosyltransferase family 2 protein [Vicingaceae bacterium]
MSKKKVSILIPLYNAEKYISATIDSILNQNYNNIEIVIVDDGSTDNSLSIVKEYQSDKIKIISQQNLGGCAARNKAFKNSTGDYIIFFDADDLMYKDKIKNQMNLVERYGDDYIYSSQWISFTGEISTSFPPKTIIDKDFDSPIEWLTTSWQNRSGAVGIWLTPRQLIEKAGGWNETLLVNQDGDFFFRVLLNTKGVKFADEAYMFYRRDVETSISKRYVSEKANSMLQSYINYEAILELDNTYDTKKALAYNYIKFIYIHYPKHQDLIKLAWDRINLLKVNENWKIGGKKFQLLSSIIGFKNTLKMKKLI